MNTEEILAEKKEILNKLKKRLGNWNISYRVYREIHLEMDILNNEISQIMDERDELTRFAWRN